jgi:hypothetical protein
VILLDNAEVKSHATYTRCEWLRMLCKYYTQAMDGGSADLLRHLTLDMPPRILVVRHRAQAHASI